MPMSANIGSYTDIRRRLDAAIAAGGAKWRLPTREQATAQRQRIYRFRKLFHDRYGGDDYYHYEVVRDPDDDACLVIRPREAPGELETLDGQPLAETPSPEVEEDEDMLDQIAELKRELDLE